MYRDRDVPYPVPATGSSRRGTLCSRGCHRGARRSARGPGHRWWHGDSSAPCPRSTMPAGTRPGHHGGCCRPVPPRARLRTCGMGQHPQAPSGVTQQVALLGHSDVPSGHRSVDTAVTPARARARARRSVTVVLMAQGTPVGGSAPTARPCLSFPTHSAGLGSAPLPRPHLSLPLSVLWGWWKTPDTPPPYSSLPSTPPHGCCCS